MEENKRIDFINNVATSWTKQKYPERTNKAISALLNYRDKNNKHIVDTLIYEIKHFDECLNFKSNSLVLLDTIQQFHTHSLELYNSRYNSPSELLEALSYFDISAKDAICDYIKKD